MVVSSAFESAYGLAQLAQLAAVIDRAEQPASDGRPCRGEETAAHGLGTAEWFQTDVSEQLSQQLTAARLDVEALAAASRRFVSCCSPPASVLGPALAPAAEVRRSVRIGVTLASGDSVVYDFAVTELLPGASGVCADLSRESRSPPVVFLHGFLGAADDWLPVMGALHAAGRRCVAIDLPGHGGSSGVDGSGEPARVDAFSAEAVVEALAQLLEQLCPVPCDLVGYSLGGRLALLLAVRHPHVAARCAVVSASAGLRDVPARAQRAAADDVLAKTLLRLGRRDFVEHWYGQSIWESLRRHPCFAAVRDRRQQGRKDQQDEDRALTALAAALSGLSVGRQPSAWDALPSMTVPLLVRSAVPAACSQLFQTQAVLQCLAAETLASPRLPGAVPTETLFGDLMSCP